MTEPTTNLRLASQVEDGFPYDVAKTVAYMVVERGRLRQIDLATAREMAKKGRAVYGAWPGQWRTDVFLLDDLPLRPKPQRGKRGTESRFVIPADRLPEAQRLKRLHPLESSGGHERQEGDNWVMDLREVGPHLEAALRGLERR